MAEVFYEVYHHIFCCIYAKCMLTAVIFFAFRLQAKKCIIFQKGVYYL
jgi:hypothetical protein